MPSEKTQQLIASQRTDADFPYLIKITHENESGESYYFYTNSNLTSYIDYNGNRYHAAVFSIDPPDKDGAKIGNAALTISAIDQFWTEKIRDTQIPAKLEFIAAIVHDETGVAGIEPLESNSFTLRAAQWNEVSITWDMSFDERQGYIITSVKCTPQITSGCA